MLNHVMVLILLQMIIYHYGINLTDTTNTIRMYAMNDLYFTVIKLVRTKLGW